MNYEEFCKLTSEARKIESYGWGKDVLSELALEISWETGGMQGGSCWNDDEPTSYSSSETEPDFESFDQLLEKVCPNISFLQYKNICSQVGRKYDSSLGEYYGNCTNYAHKYIDMKELYDCLVDKEIIND